MGGRGPAGGRVATLPGIVALAAILTGCGLWPFDADPGYQAVTFENETTETVAIIYTPPNGPEFVLIHSIEPGRSVTNDAVAGGGCSAGVLIARAVDGDELDRRDQPLCLGETWHIGDPDPAASG